MAQPWNTNNFTSQVQWKRRIILVWTHNIPATLDRFKVVSVRVRERATPELIECPRPPSSNQNIQMKRHRRERRRTRRPPNVPDSAIINNNNDIEEQLRIQRLKKNKTEASTSSTTRLPNDDTSQMVLGNYTFDPQRNAYFPTVTRTNHPSAYQNWNGNWWQG